MGVFAYQALDADQAKVRGTLVADTPRQARDLLRSRGLVVEDLHPAAPQVSHWGRWGGLGTSPAQVAMLVRELSTLLSVGIPLLEALQTLGRQHRGRLKVQIQHLHDQIAAGSSFSEAMATLPTVFNEFAISIAQVGENAGTLDVSLARLADFQERAGQFKSRIGTALLYPAIVLAMAVGVSLFLMTYVVPKLLAGLLEAGRPIPWPTQIVKAASDLLCDHGLLLAVLAALVVAGLVALVRWPPGHRAWHKVQLRLPILGDLLRKQAISRLAIVLSTLLRSGVVFVRALQIAQRSATNVVLREALVRGEAAVHGGQDIARALENTGAFPPTVISIFAVGEQSGRLEDMLERLAADYDRQVDTATSRLTAVLEPLLVVLLVCVVGLIAFATVLPMLEAANVL